MANTIAKAIRYLSEPEAIRNVLNHSLRTVDLEVPNIFVGSNSVKYQHIEFGDYTLGSYNRATGYANNDINLTWKDFVLTQDKGNALMIDRMDDEESTANGIVFLGNRFYDKVANPEVDSYRLQKLAALSGSNVKNLTLTSANIVAAILEGKAMLENYKVDASSLLLYITPACKALLKEVALTRGYWKQGGEWNGQLDAEIDTFDGIKVVAVPSSYFGTYASTVQAVLLHKDAAPAFVKYKEAVYFDKVAGFGNRKLEVDIGIYHDAFVYDELNRAVCLFIATTSTTKSITYAKGDASATGTAPTQAATVPGGTFTVATNTFSLTGKTFAGWTDGFNVYKEGDTYSMPNANVTLTALWK